MSYLLDVNVLVAWGWTDHADHNRAVRWLADCKRTRGLMLMTSPIPELGFIRVSVQRAAGRISVKMAADVLRGMLGALGAKHRFLADDLHCEEWPAWCTSAAHTTDGHLLLLAKRHGIHLATLDAGIPGARLLPG